MKNLINFYKDDKIKLIRFCLKQGISRTAIAKELDISPSAITYLLQGGQNDRLAK
jgi:transposase-like protein